MFYVFLVGLAKLHCGATPPSVMVLLHLLSCYSRRISRSMVKSILVYRLLTTTGVYSTIGLVVDNQSLHGLSFNSVLVIGHKNTRQMLLDMLRLKNLQTKCKAALCPSILPQDMLCKSQLASELFLKIIVQTFLGRNLKKKS